MYNIYSSRVSNINGNYQVNPYSTYPAIGLKHGVSMTEVTIAGEREKRYCQIDGVSQYGTKVSVIKIIPDHNGSISTLYAITFESFYLEAIDPAILHAEEQKLIEGFKCEEGETITSPPSIADHLKNILYVHPHTNKIGLTSPYGQNMVSMLNGMHTEFYGDPQVDGKNEQAWHFTKITNKDGSTFFGMPGAVVTNISRPSDDPPEQPEEIGYSLHERSMYKHGGTSSFGVGRCLMPEDIILFMKKMMAADAEEVRNKFLSVNDDIEKAKKVMPAEMRAILVKQFGVKCWGCNFMPPDERYLELDHISPKSEYGSNDIDNRALLCTPCNRKKSDKISLSALRKQNERDNQIQPNPPVDLQEARQWTREYQMKLVRPNASST